MRWDAKPKEYVNPFWWHEWFAWHPVCIRDKWIWWEVVFRMRYDPGPGSGETCPWIYAKPEDMEPPVKKVEDK